jgi:hypothetical protein
MDSFHLCATAIVAAAFSFVFGSARMSKSSKNLVMKLLWCGMLLVPLCDGVQSASAQVPESEIIAIVRRRLPPAAERALAEVDRASYEELRAVEQRWRTFFHATRNRETLKGFVGDSIDIFEKLRQVHDLAANPGGTDARVTTMFRKRIMDADAVCNLLDTTVVDYCRVLDEHDQTLLIKLKIDREAGRTTLSRSEIDPSSFKRTIHAVASSAVTAVQNDMARSIVSFVASEAIGIGAKRAARDFGINRTEEGSAADFITGLLIDIGINMVVDAATDPTSKIVDDLESRLRMAERSILDGDVKRPGVITTLRRITNERAEARRALVEAEVLK